MESCRDYLQNYVIRLLSNDQANNNNQTQWEEEKQMNTTYMQS